jgi:hypothetical protein
MLTQMKIASMLAGLPVEEKSEREFRRVSYPSR